MTSCSTASKVRNRSSCRSQWKIGTKGDTVIKIVIDLEEELVSGRLEPVIDFDFVFSGHFGSLGRRKGRDLAFWTL